MTDQQKKTYYQLFLKILTSRYNHKLYNDTIMKELEFQKLLNNNYNAENYWRNEHYWNRPTDQLFNQIHQFIDFNKLENFLIENCL